MTMNRTASRLPGATRLCAAPRSSGLLLSLLFVVGTNVSCTADPPGVGDHPIEIYAPQDDPLVNPARTFDPYPAEDPDSVATDETLVRYMLGSPRSLNPIFAILWEDFFLAAALFEAPITRDITMEWIWNDRLVESVVESDDHKVFTVRFREEARWHDGTPWTAHDVRFTYQAIMDPRVPASFYKLQTSQLEDVVVIDDHTVEYRHRHAVAPRMQSMSFPIIPKHVLDLPAQRATDPTLRSSEYYNRFNREAVIGSAAYRFVEWIPNDRVVLERWEDHWIDYHRPNFRRIVFKMQSDRNLALLEFKKGEIDDIMLTPQQFATQTNDRRFEEVGIKVWAPMRRQGYIGWNQDGSNPFFQDVRVRQAMAHAYDAESVIRNVTYGLYLPAVSIFDPDHWAHDPTLRGFPFDLERASTLLDEAGWRIDERDGWRYRVVDGEPVRFEFELTMANTFKDCVKLAAIYGEDLRRLGIEMRTRVNEYAAHITALSNHEFEAHCDVTEQTADPDRWADYLTTEGYENGRNYEGYSNTRVDELFELGRLELDREKRAEIYREISGIQHEEQGFLPIWNYSLIYGLSKRLRGIELAPSGIYLFAATPPPGWPSNLGPGWWVERGDALRLMTLENTGG